MESQKVSWEQISAVHLVQFVTLARWTPLEIHDP